MSIKVSINWNNGKEILQDFMINKSAFNSEMTELINKRLEHFSNGDITALLISDIDAFLYRLIKDELPPESPD